MRVTDRRRRWTRESAGAALRALVLASMVVGGIRPVQAQLGSIVPPDRVVTLENDSIKVTIAVGPEILITSLRYEPRDLEFIRPDAPMPLVGIENTWTLNNVGLGLREVEVEPGSPAQSMRIHAYSNYLENPFHLFAELRVVAGAALDARIWLENRHEPGYHDLYREDDWTEVVPGLPWLSHLAPHGAGDRTVIFPSDDGYRMETLPESRPEPFRPYDAWERPPPPVAPILQFYRNPLFPTIVSFAGIDMTAALQRRESDLSWNFDSPRDALSPSSEERIGLQDTVVVFDGTLRLLEGDWHAAFDAFRDSLRADFDFTYYDRPGYARYRKDFLAYHSFLFNHQLYDPEQNRFTIEEFLRKAGAEVGGYDQFYFWHAYPRVGVDPRDQFDLFEDLPNGVDGIRDFVSAANALSTHVYLAYNPWDRIRARDDMYGEMASVVGRTGADGVLLDTMGESDLDFREKVDRHNPDAQFVTEGRPPWSGLTVTTSSWDHPPTSHAMPRVDLLRFVLPEHRAFQIVRWDRDRKPLIYKAFFNATGYVVWEDIFGEINLQSWDEQVLLYRYGQVMRDFARAVNGTNPIPLLPTTHDYLSVNGFRDDAIHLYTIYQQQHESQLHFFDTRVIGPLFEMDVPAEWHVVDVWNKRPVELRTIEGRQFVYLPQEMPEDLGAIAAMPRQIEVTRVGDSWTASLRAPAEGTLELMGIDQMKRNLPGPSVAADQTLSFGAGTVPRSTDGYVVLHYRDASGDVRDVELVRVSR